jgi:type VI secretion system protein ImpL
MNTLQWEGAPDLSSAIEQLTLLADARQSPLIALMNSLQYQAGASAAHQSLSDTLVAKAQSVLARDDGPTPAQADPAGALGAPFAPVLRLLTQGERGASDLSLQRYLERVTALRLKLQQIHHSPDADAQARLAAQALFQGRGSELADTQAYAQLLAASLGAQWAGMGEALFVRPVAQATRTVLQPAQASLNRAWREGVVASWERSFAGRYPFASTDNDASLAELARWLRPQGGLIDTFVGGQLAGVLELQGDQWVPAARSGAALAFDPAFLDALNTLQRVGAHLLAQGEAQYRFELMALPTPGLTDTVLMLDDQQLHYYNQRQSWQALRWPVSAAAQPGTRLQWQTEMAGTNKNYEFGGRWALLRMLERARVEPVDSATYRLTWQGVPDAQWRDEDEPSTAGDGAGTAGQQHVAAAGQAAASNVTASTAATSSAAASNAAPPGSLNDSLNAQGPRVPAYGGPPLALNYVMRTEIGRGPLELLALRGFVLPQRIFVSAPQPGVSASHAERPVVAADARYAAAAQARPAAQPWTVPPLPSLPQAPVAETASHAKEHTSAQTEVQTFTRPEETQNHTQLPATTRATL